MMSKPGKGGASKTVTAIKENYIGNRVGFISQNKASRKEDSIY